MSKELHSTETTNNITSFPIDYDRSVVIFQFNYLLVFLHVFLFTHPPSRKSKEVRNVYIYIYCFCDCVNKCPFYWVHIENKLSFHSNKFFAYFSIFYVCHATFKRIGEIGYNYTWCIFVFFLKRTRVRLSQWSIPNRTLQNLHLENLYPSELSFSRRIFGNSTDFAWKIGFKFYLSSIWKFFYVR